MNIFSNRVLRFIANSASILAADTVNLFKKNPLNIGDMHCSPSQYFEIGSRCVSADVHSKAFIHDKNLVFGGGGLLTFDAHIARVIDRHRRGHMIGWGLGTNRHGRYGPEPFPQMLSKLGLLGMRDDGFQGKAIWVPCVSALNRAFDQNIATAKSDFVVFSHQHFPLKTYGFPQMTNDGQISLVNVLQFLAAGDTVVTNSYHGVYWATLLGRKVFCVPFSSKFYRFRHPPVMVDGNWLHLRPKASHFPEALAECRDANIAFSRRVAERLECKMTPKEDNCLARRFVQHDLETNYAQRPR